jgi:hypothetical protein
MTVNRRPPIRIGYLVQILVCLLVFQRSGRAQQVDSPKTPDQSVEFVPLPPSATAGITEHPLEVDMSLAEQFVKLGFGPQILGQRGFQSTQFLTPPLSTRQASQLVQLIPEWEILQRCRGSKGHSAFFWPRIFRPVRTRRIASPLYRPTLLDPPARGTAHKGRRSAHLGSRKSAARAGAKKGFCG